MKEVVINGVKYFPAASIAKEFRYTTDYIGQLCRSRKVDAQLVGRSWYVNPLSLKAHKQARYVKVQTNDALVAEAVKVNFTKIEILPNDTASIPKRVEKNFAKRIDWQPLKYEADKGELLPPISKHPVTTNVQVELADSTDIPIKIKEEPISMIAEPLPTVSLSGVLNVVSIEDNFQAEASYIKEDSLLNDIPLPPVPVVVKNKPLVRPVTLSNKNSTVSDISFQKKVVHSDSLVLPVLPVSSKKVEDETESSDLLEITLMVTSTTLTILLFVFLFSESSVLASANSYVSSINFTTESLTALSSFFYTN